MAEFIENQNSSYSFSYGLHKLAKDIAIQVLWHQPKRESIYSFVAEYLKNHLVLQDEEKATEFIVRELLDNYLTQCDTIVSQRSRLSAEEEHRAAKIIQVAFRGFQARQRPAENDHFMSNDSLNIEALDQGETVPENYVERHTVNLDLPMDTTGWEANRHRAASVIQQKYRRISANSNRVNRPPAEPQIRWRQRFAGESATCTLTVDAIEAVITTSRAAITTQEPWLESADNVVVLDETTPTYRVLDLTESGEETLSATDESSWDDLTITGTDSQSSSTTDLLETTDISRTDLFETVDSSRTDLLETTDIRSTYLLETTDRRSTDLLETTNRKSTDLLETTDRKGTDLLEITNRKSTDLLANTDRRSTDLLETTDRRSTDPLANTDMITESLDALICDILNKSGLSLNLIETETQSFVESLPRDEDVERSCGEAEQLESCVETFHDETQIDLKKQVDESTLLDRMVEVTGELSCVDNEINTAAQTVKKELSADFLEAQGIISEALNVLSKSDED